MVLKLIVDMESIHPLHVDFANGLGKMYLFRRGDDYYLKRDAAEITKETVRETVK